MPKLTFPVVLSLGVLLCSFGLLLCDAALGQSTQNATPPAPAQISADLGTCSATLHVSGADAKPVYAAKVTTRIHYGAFGVKRLDLEAFTDAEGQLKITHLPEILKKPMYIHVTKDDKDEMVEFKPSERCEATFDVQLK
jgi:hypothetical protein